MKGEIFSTQLVIPLNIFVEHLLENAKITRLLGIFNPDCHQENEFKSKIIHLLRTLLSIYFHLRLWPRSSFGCKNEGFPEKTNQQKPKKTQTSLI